MRQSLLQSNDDHKFYLTEIETDRILVGQKVSVLGYPLSDTSIVNKERISPGVIQTMGDDKSIKDGILLDLWTLLRGNDWTLPDCKPNLGTSGFGPLTP